MKNRKIWSFTVILSIFLLYCFNPIELFSQPAHKLVNYAVPLHISKFAVDSTSVEEVADSTADNSADSLSTDEDEADADSISTNWTFDAANTLNSQQLQHGIKNDNGKPTNTFSAGISHDVGLSLKFSGTKDFATTPIIGNWSVDLGYEYSLNDWLSLEASIGRTNYAYDITNIFSLAQNEFSLSADADFGKLSIDLNYRLKFGNDNFHFLALSIARPLKISERFTILPVFSAEYSYYSLDIQDATSVLSAAKLAKLLSNHATNTKKVFVVKQNGISSVGLAIIFDYELGRGFDLDLTPGITYPPIDLTLKKKIQYGVALGVSYSLDF